MADDVDEDRTSCLRAAKLSLGVPGVIGVSGVRDPDDGPSGDGTAGIWYSLRTTTSERCVALRLRRSETYSSAGTTCGGRWWASRMEVPASSGEEILSLRDIMSVSFGSGCLS